jgi:GrpB-like predicted nucleotidyltransferase (UPF0157 family)
MTDKTINIVSYDVNWPRLFEEESQFIQSSLKDNTVAIHHIGSTAVPGLCAKPIIDIIAVVKNLKASVPAMESLGYQFGGELNIPFRYYFKKRGCQPEINLHIYESSHPEIALNLAFRDHLRTHERDREAYAQLKQTLAAQKELHKKKGARFSGYNLGKNQLIKSLLNKAGFKGLCMRLCTHHDEWEAVRQLGSSADSPLALYQGTDIIGYADIRIENDTPKELLSFYLTDCFGKEKIYNYFYQRCNLWIEARMKNESAALAAALENNGICPAQAKMMAKTETFLQRIGMATPGSRPVHHLKTDGLGNKSLISFNLDTTIDSNPPQSENRD